jgi:hypothetical protein
VSSGPFTHDLPENVTLRLAETMRIALPSAMGAGNTWQVSVDGMAAAATITVVPPPQPVGTSEGGRPPSTSTAAEFLTITGVLAGSAQVALRLGRSWEAGLSLAEHHIAVTVLER